MQIMLAESLQDSVHIFFMLLLVAAKYEDVIEIDYNKYVNHIAEYVVHEVLECSRRISHPKQHDQVLKGPIACAEGGLPLVTW